MQTVYVTNNAYDSILLVDSGDRVIGAWTVNPKIKADYLRDGADANNWEPTYPGSEAISDYGTELGRDGVL